MLICESAADHCPTVDADQYGCSTAIVDYLMSKGHKTVYHIAGPSTSRAAESRARGWREALEQMGARVPSMYIGDWCADSGYQAGVALAHDPDCTAIYAANDQMAYGAMLGLQSVGKRVPEDVSIVGVDDSLVDMVPRLNLTTMKLRFDDIGATAFSMVRRQCEGEKIPVGVKTVIPPELIERGYVYIAQPPLYKAKRGNSILYLKDDREMEDYLIRGGCEDAFLQKQNGEQIAGSDLITLVENTRKVRSLIATLGKKAPEKIIEQMAIHGLFDKNLTADRDAFKKTLDNLAVCLDSHEAEYDKGWLADLNEDNSFTIHRTLRGVKEEHVIGSTVMDSPEAVILNEMRTMLLENFAQASVLVSKNGVEIRIPGPVAFVDAVMAAGKKGITIQRYKGLGEMNPEQLWETTLDPEARSLLQVKMEHLDEADETFATLMGDVVEPRKEFIQDNALNVVNLDI